MTEKNIRQNIRHLICFCSLANVSQTQSLWLSTKFQHFQASAENTFFCENIDETYLSH